MSMPFDDVSVLKESPKDGTIRFKLSNLQKGVQPIVNVNGNTLKVSVTSDGDLYGREISGLDIQGGVKTSVGKTTIDVTVVKNGNFSIGGKI